MDDMYCNTNYENTAGHPIMPTGVPDEDEGEFEERYETIDYDAVPNTPKHKYHDNQRYTGLQPERATSRGSRKSAGKTAASPQAENIALVPTSNSTKKPPLLPKPILQAKPDTPPPEVKDKPTHRKNCKCKKIVFCMLFIALLVLVLLATSIYLFITTYRMDKDMAALQHAVEFISSRCGGVRNANTSLQPLYSPYYPDEYGPYHNCTWTLTGGPNRWLNLQYGDSFDVPCGTAGISMYTNLNDTLTPVSVNGINIKNYCGSAPPFNTVTIQQNKVIVVFKSNPRSSGGGFGLYYQTLYPCYGEIILSNNTRSGSLTSPNYPNPYPHGARCGWTVQAPDGKRLSASFVGTFALQKDGDTCEQDHVSVRDGDSASSAELLKACGNSKPSPVTSTNNTLYITFHSDSTEANAGFNITFSIIV